MPIVDSFLMELDQEAKTTQRILERVPEDKLSWKPHPKSYSLGQLAMHIAIGPGRVASAATEDVREFTPPPVPEPKTRKEIMDAFAESCANAKKIVKSFDDG